MGTKSGTDRYKRGPRREWDIYVYLDNLRGGSAVTGGSWQ
jgi:hypothetical protein